MTSTTKNDKALRRLTIAEHAERGHNAALTEHADGLAESATHTMNRISRNIDGVDNPDLRSQMGEMYLRAGYLRTMAHTLRGTLGSVDKRLNDR